MNLVVGFLILLGGNERAGYAAGTVGAQIEALARDNGLVGDGYSLAPVGASEMIGESVADFAEAIVLAIVLTLLTLAAILESWRKPFLVLATIPMALIGVLWVLRLSGLTVSIFVLLGAVMLIGVVSGTYSSVFIATPIMMWWYRGKRPEFEVEAKEQK